MTDRWHKFFVGSGAFDRSWLASAVEHWSFSERLRGNLLEILPQGSRILEVGCGPGNSGLLLSSLGFKYTGVDNEARLVELATSLRRRLGCNANFEAADARDLSRFYGKFDLAFLSGVLEHFERQETVELLREQAKCARLVVISIPTRWTRYTGTITDERLYSVRELRNLVREAELIPIRTFGYGDITANRWHLAAYSFLPRIVLRRLQDLGYAYAIAVAGESKLFCEFASTDGTIRPS